MKRRGCVKLFFKSICFLLFFLGHDSGPAWEAAFQNTYIQFVKNVTTRYQNPKLPIFVAQGPMNCGANLNASLQIVVSAVNAAGGAAYYLPMCTQIANDGCGGHPGVVASELMFQQAQPVIAKVMGW